MLEKLIRETEELKDMAEEGLRFWEQALRNSPLQLVGDNGEWKLERRR